MHPTAHATRLHAFASSDTCKDILTMSVSATAAAVHADSSDPHALPPDEHFGAASAGKLGMWIFLLSDAFSFGGLLLGYGILRGGAGCGRAGRVAACGRHGR